jgi:hypothetical protein
MRLTLLTTLLICGAALGAQQDDKARMPKKGDAVVIKGCLRGSSVESADLMVEDREGAVQEQAHVPPLTYRLQGDKALLKDLKSKFDRMVVEVKGTLQSELSKSGIGTAIGRTRITIGADPKTGRLPQGADQIVPVLEAKSFEGSAVSCGK